MSIRNAAKAIILHDGKVLLNKCCDSTGTIYYALPGGGQNQYETMEEAVIRECLEETGYLVIPIKFIALYEEIFNDPEARKNNPNYTHKIYHVFICKLSQEVVQIATEKDSEQVGCQWVDIQNIMQINLFPLKIRNNLQQLVNADTPLYLGSDHID